MASEDLVIFVAFLENMNFTTMLIKFFETTFLTISIFVVPKECQAIHSFKVGHFYVLLKIWEQFWALIVAWVCGDWNQFGVC